MHHNFSMKLKKTSERDSYLLSAHLHALLFTAFIVVTGELPSPEPPSNVVLVSAVTPLCDMRQNFSKGCLCYGDVLDIICHCQNLFHLPFKSFGSSGKLGFKQKNQVLSLNNILANFAKAHHQLLLISCGMMTCITSTLQ